MLMRLLILSLLCLQAASTFPFTKNKKQTKMKVEIWSDVMCPFCYIGKRRFETALAQFPNKQHVQVEWKSFQLQPDLKTAPDKNAIEHLAESKGWTLAYARQAVEQVVSMAKSVGLNYNYDKTVVANSFDAHRLAHFAKLHHKGNDIEEQLFKAHFIDGKNIADYNVLADLAVAAGLDRDEALRVLKENKYAKEVQADIAQSQEIGVSGVPFFVFNEKYAISGAQAHKVFLEVLEKSFSEWQKKTAKHIWT